MIAAFESPKTQRIYEEIVMNINKQLPSLIEKVIGKMKKEYDEQIASLKKEIVSLKGTASASATPKKKSTSAKKKKSLPITDKE